MAREVIVTHNGKAIKHFHTIRQAENFIALEEKGNPEGVHRGDYGIEASSRAEAVWQRLKH